jgi:hypothetical protein
MITNISIGWVQSVRGLQILDSFASAWASIINALSGQWGSFEYEIIPGTRATAEFYRGLYFISTTVTGQSGTRTISLPAVSLGGTIVSVYNTASNPVSLSEYIVNDGSSTVQVTLPASCLIKINGKVRKI